MRAVIQLCNRFGVEYWRKLDETATYPEEFVKALTDAGWLAALIPEEYGGSGPGYHGGLDHPRGDQPIPVATPARVHAQMYIMGTLLRHGSDAQKQKYLPKIASGELRLQSFGVTEPSVGTDTTKIKTTAVRNGDHYLVNGQKVWTSRVQHSDLMLLLARTTPLDQIKKKSEGLSVFLVDLETVIGNGLTVVPIRNMPNHETNELFFDDVVVPAENLIGEEGRGFRYYPRWHECRTDLDRDRMYRRRALVHREGSRLRPRAGGFRPAHRAKTRGFNFPSRAHMSTSRRPISCDSKRPHCSTIRSHARRKPTWPSCWGQMRRGKPPTRLCRRMVASGFAARVRYRAQIPRDPGSIKLLPISTNLILSYIGEHVLKMPRSF